MIYCLQNRQLPILTDAGWQREPWNQSPQHDSQILIGHGLSLAVVLYNLKCCLEYRNDPSRLCEKLFGCVPELYSVSHSLDEWWTLNCTPSWALSETASSLAIPPHLNCVDANAIIIYWALRTLLATVGEVLSRFVPMTAYTAVEHDSHLSSSQIAAFLAQDFAGLCTDSASKIVAVAEYMHRPEMGLLGAQMTLMPLKVAQTTFRRLNHPGIIRCDSLFARLATDKGLGFARVLQKSGLSPSQQTNGLDY